MRLEDTAVISLLDFMRAAQQELGVRQATGDSLYARLHRIAARAVPVDSCYVCFYSQTEGTLFFPYNFDGRIYNDPITMPLGNGPTSWVARHDQPLVLSAANEVIQRGGTRFGDPGRVSRSAVHVPIHGTGDGGEARLIGVFSVQSYQADAYGEGALRLLQWLADQAGTRVQREREAAAGAERSAAMVPVFLQILGRITGEIESLFLHLPKDNGPLLDAVYRLRRTCYRSQAEAGQLAQNGLPAGTYSGGKLVPNALSTLTEREQEVLALLCSDATYGEMAEQLYIGKHTVKFHCQNIYRKLNVKGRLQAIQAARFPQSNEPPTQIGR